MGKYTQGEAKIPGAEKFYSQNEANQNYINELATHRDEREASYDGKKAMHVALSGDAARLYRYNPETKSFERDFYNETFDNAYEKFPELHFRYIDSKDLTSINNGSYFYFEAGGTVPIDAVTQKPLGDDFYKNNPDCKAAIENLKNERAALDLQKLKAEVLRHNAQLATYDLKRTRYLNQEMLGSSVSNVGSDECRDFAQNVNRNLAKEHPDLDLEYKAEGSGLTEADMVALTYLSFGNPDVLKDAVSTPVPEAAAVGSLTILPNDFFIQRTGKHGKALNSLIAARQDVQKTLDEYKKNKDINVLAKAVVNGILMCGISNNHRQINAIGVGGLTSSTIIKEFLKKPGLFEAAQKEAQRQGKANDFLEGFKYIDGQDRIYNLFNEQNSINTRLADLIDGRVDDVSPEERDKEIARLEEESSINDTVFSFRFAYDKTLENLFKRYSPDLLTNTLDELTNTMRGIAADKSLTPKEIIDRQHSISASVNITTNYFSLIEPISAVKQLLGSSGGMEVLRDVIKRSGLKGDSPETIEKLTGILEKSGIIPPLPAERNKQTMDEYRKTLKSFDADLAVSRYNINKMFAKTDELVSVQNRHEEIGKDLLESSIGEFAEKSDIQINTENYDKFFKYGEKYTKGLFALKTDSSDMFFNMRKPEDAERAKALQKEIDAVEIPKSKVFSDRLIELAVFGRALSDDRMFQAKDIAFEAGSSLPTGLSLRSKIESFVFYNMLSDDNRFNTHFLRAVIPDARKDIKEAVINGSDDVIKQSLNQMFKSCLGNCMSQRDTMRPDWVYTAQRLSDINIELKKNGMSLSDIGLSASDQKKFSIINSNLELASRLVRNNDFIEGCEALFDSSEGLDEKANPKTNPKLYAALTENMVINKIMSRVSDEINAIDFVDFDMENSDQLWAERDATPTEELLGSNPQVLIDYYTERINNNYHYKNFLEAKTTKEISSILHQKGISYGRDEVVASGADVFEEKFAPTAIRELRKALQLGIKDLQANPIDNSDIAISKMENCLGVLDRLEAARKDIKDFSSPEALNQLRPLYEEYQKYDKPLKTIINRCEKYPAWYNEYFNYLGCMGRQLKQINSYQSVLDDISTIKHDMQISEKEPNAVSNLKDSIKLVDELGKGQTANKEFSDFREHLSELSTMMEASFGKDKAVSDRINASMVSEKYAQVISDINALDSKKSNGLSDKLKFVISGIKTSLESEFTNEIQPLEKSEGGFAKAYADNVKNNPGANIVREKNAFKSAMQRLEAVATRVGGNSKEFQSMLDDARAMQASQDDKGALRKASDKLLKSVNNYIKAKKVAPSTEKGQTRLGIAKELKDITRNLYRDLTADIAKDARESYLSKTVTVMDKLKEKSQKAVANIAEAWKSKNAKAILNNVSALVYLDGVEKNAETLGEKRVADMISPERINASVKQINKLSENVIKNFEIAGLENAIKEGNLGAFVIKSYNKLGLKEAAKLKATEAAQKAADKADAILARQNKRPAAVGGISL